MQPGDIQFMDQIKKGTGGDVKCIENGGSLKSIMGNMQTLAAEGCKKIAQDKTFAGEFNVIGLSQGGLFARYIAEECDMPGKVRNLVTLGGPHMGVDAIPHCFSGAICDIVNAAAKKLVYETVVQDNLVPAGYFRDINDYATYVNKSVFLPPMNNEHLSGGYVSKLRMNNFKTINAGLFIMFSEDTMIYPKETAWFQSVDVDGKV